MQHDDPRKTDRHPSGAMRRLLQIYRCKGCGWRESKDLVLRLPRVPGVFDVSMHQSMARDEGVVSLIRIYRSASIPAPWCESRFESEMLCIPKHAHGRCVRWKVHAAYRRHDNTLQIARPDF